MRKGDRQDGPAFTMEAGDRFHCILCSKPVAFDDESKSEVILTFFVIRRANSTYTICNVNRTYDSKGECVTRTVQGKEGIPAGRIEAEVEAIRDAFSKGIEKGSGRRLEWDCLNLSGVPDMAGQVRRIKEWGHVGAWTEADVAPWN